MTLKLLQQDEKEFLILGKVLGGASFVVGSPSIVVESPLFVVGFGGDHPLLCAEILERDCALAL